MRLASRLMLGLLAGFLISLLVAWAAALWSPIEYDGRWTTYNQPPLQLPFPVPLDLIGPGKPMRFDYLRCSGPGVRFDELAMGSLTLYSWRNGWPLPCFRGTATFDPATLAELPRQGVVGIPATLRPRWRKWCWWYRPMDD